MPRTEHYSDGARHDVDEDYSKVAVRLPLTSIIAFPNELGIHFAQLALRDTLYNS